jgi:hypothetical protein
MIVIVDFLAIIFARARRNPCKCNGMTIHAIKDMTLACASHLIQKRGDLVQNT